MKLIFAGPSLYGAKIGQPCNIELRPPAAKGDVVKAVEEGAVVIGLIDGYFENTAAVWHKEILHALSLGVQVFGAASIGALRAAECSAFGMVGIGRIYQGYATGQLVDDADVALLHAPSDLGYAPLSEPMVNVRATLNHLLHAGLISRSQSQSLMETASSTFYKRRTWKSIIAATPLTSSEYLHITRLVRALRVDQKMLDAVELVKAVELANGVRSQEPSLWDFSHTSYFHMLAT